MLTQKQENYVQNLIKGMSQRQAYLSAFPNSRKWKEATVDNNAYMLLKKNEVLARYKELQKKVEDEAIITAKEMQKMYTDVLKGNKKFKDYIIQDGKVVEIEVPIKATDWNRASELLMKLQGAYINKIELEEKTPRVNIIEDLDECKDD